MNNIVSKVKKGKAEYLKDCIEKGVAKYITEDGFSTLAWNEANCCPDEWTDNIDDEYPMDFVKKMLNTINANSAESGIEVALVILEDGEDDDDIRCRISFCMNGADIKKLFYRKCLESVKEWYAGWKTTKETDGVNLFLLNVHCHLNGIETKNTKKYFNARTKDEYKIMSLIDKAAQDVIKFYEDKLNAEQALSVAK